MDNQLLNYTGKGAMIARASSGIGRATALAFARQSAKICIGDVSAGAGETVELIKKEGGEALFVKTDVTQATSVEALVRARWKLSAIWTAPSTIPAFCRPPSLSPRRRTPTSTRSSPSISGASFCA